MAQQRRGTPDPLNSERKALGRRSCATECVLGCTRLADGLRRVDFRIGRARVSVTRDEGVDVWHTGSDVSDSSDSWNDDAGSRTATEQSMQQVTAHRNNSVGTDVALALRCRGIMCGPDGLEKCRRGPNCMRDFSTVNRNGPRHSGALAKSTCNRFNVAREKRRATALPARTPSTTD